MHTYEVIVSRQGIPLCEVEVTLDASSPACAAEAVKRSRCEDNEHVSGDTYDAVERSDELVHYAGLELEYAVLAAIGTSPGFAEHVRGVAFS